MDRIRGIREHIARKRLGAFVVSNLSNIRYLTGFTGSSALMVITSDDSLFVTDFRYQEQSHKEVKDSEIVIAKGSLVREVKRFLRLKGIKRVGFEYSAAYSLYHELKKDFLPVACREFVENFRAIKDTEELSSIKKAVKRAEEAFKKVRKAIRKGVTERAIAVRLEDALRRSGCKGIPFDIIIASGPNAALPHATASNRRLRAGDLVVIDWGGEADGYYSDMTRTLLIRGKGTEEKTKIYNTVLEANTEAIKAVQAGKKAKEIDAVARGIIAEAGYGEYFGHATGHGVGLDIHELPRLSLRSRDILRQGMVFTIEPGIYLPEIGGVRIEDMIYLSDKGPRVLTTLPKKLEIV